MSSHDRDQQEKPPDRAVCGLNTSVLYIPVTGECQQCSSHHVFDPKASSFLQFEDLKTVVKAADSLGHTSVSAIMTQVEHTKEKLELGPLRVLAVSQLQTWMPRNTPLKEAILSRSGYKFRVVIRDETRTIDAVVWHEKFLPLFITAKATGKTIVLDDVVAQVKKCGDDTCCASLNIELHVHWDTNIYFSPLLHDASLPTSVGETYSFEFQRTNEWPNVLDAFYAANTPEHREWPMEIPNNGGFSDPTDVVQNSFPFTGPYGVKCPFINSEKLHENDLLFKSLLSHGMCFEFVNYVPGCVQLLGSGVVVRNHIDPGEVSFVVVQSRFVKRGTIIREIHGLLHELWLGGFSRYENLDLKHRLIVRQIPRSAFPSWRARIPQAIYTALGSMKPESHSTVPSGRGSLMVKRAKEESPVLSCHVCGAEFCREDKRMQHLKAAHPEALLTHLFKCKLCPQHPGYVDYVWYNKHVAEKHAGKTPQECLMASGDSHERESMRREKKCKFCDRVYKTPGSLLKHEKFCTQNLVTLEEALRLLEE